MAVANLIAPEHLELMCADPEALVPLVRHAGAVFCGPWAPGVGGRLRRRAEPRAADVRLGPVRPGAHASTTSPKQSTCHRSTDAALERGRAARRRAGRGRGPRRARRVGAHPATGGAADDEPTARSATTSRSWRATTRRRSTSTCGSTPTSRPSRRRPRARDALAAELRRVDWHRYPDRAATELRDAIAELHGVAPDQVFAANGSNEVLQTLCLDLRRAGPHRRCRSSRPTRCTRHIARITGTTVVEGERTDDFALDLDEVDAGARRRATRRSRSCARPTTPPGMVETEATVRVGRVAARRRARRRRRGLRPVRAVVGARRWSTTTCRSSSPARSRRRGRWPRPGSATSSGPSWLVAELDKVVLPYHLDAAKQIAGVLALDVRATRWRTGSPRRRPSASASSPACAISAVERVAVGRQLRAVPAPTCRGDDVWQGLLDRRCSSATARRGRGSTAACGSRSARPTRTTRSSSAGRGAAMSVSTGVDASDATRRRPSIDVELDVDGAWRRPTSTRAPVLRPHARPARPARRLRPHGAGHRRPRGRQPPHGRGRRHPARRGVPRGARRQGRRAPVRERPRTRSTRRWSRWPSTCRAGRSSSTRCRSARSFRSATRRSTPSWPSTSGSRSPPRPRSRCT